MTGCSVLHALVVTGRSVILADTRTWQRLVADAGILRRNAASHRQETEAYEHECDEGEWQRGFDDLSPWRSGIDRVGRSTYRTTHLVGGG